MVGTGCHTGGVQALVTAYGQAGKHQLRRPLLYQAVRIENPEHRRTKVPPVGKHQSMFLRAEAQPQSLRHPEIMNSG